MLKLYHHPMSAASRYVRLLLGEYAERCELIEERPWERRRAFLAMNPAATLPVMIEDDGPAIVGGIIAGEYLDETRGVFMRDKRLMPEKPAERAEVRRLTEWFVDKLDQEVTRYLVRERVFKLDMPKGEGGGAPDASAIRAARSNFKHHFRYLGWLTENRDWLAGPRMSQADLAAAAVISILDYLGEIQWDDEPAAKDWYSRLKSRPSFRPLLTERVRGVPPVQHYADLDF
ncbi:MAG: glutathione S-transferase family protein [Fulvimarina manganoxydans]|uniref:glutathione S-transferase family protein n=1 Tax=Fulvimarina manganoxydans TaxID=937218 RepID=UPI0023555574|nr:glutathione S-transferase family protein [Fulvimarina manganoxydans]MCK5931323.1 glutathione S-transferase family protein [Fulvimarina manganoxydans]